ncbi:GyrI-like domain-containing protein [bacterium]|nr:GyrI-like domain-containing protein [bacterium]
MEPRIIYKPGFTVVGIAQNGDSGDGDALWDELGARYREIPQADPDVGYGVRSITDDDKTYLVGLAVREEGRTPPGMKSVRFEPHTYAVFVHRGRAARLPETVGAALSEWLPGSGYALAGTRYFEYYDDNFEPGSDESVIFVWVPVDPVAGE